MIPYKIPYASGRVTLPTMGDLTEIDGLHGRLSSSDIASISFVDAEVETAIARYSSRIDAQSVWLDYCFVFTPDLHRCVCPLPGRAVTAIKSRREVLYGAGSITLVTAAWEEDYLTGALDAMLDSWVGPKVRCLPNKLYYHWGLTVRFIL